ncbi:MAG: radical SAM protein [Dorea sp.]|nr:radical SAM protein [Dorea sp.]
MTHTKKRELFLKGKAMGLPVSGTFELTKRCNLHCRMCYIHDHHQTQELTAEQWIHLGQEACRQGMLYLLLTGGEPWIREDFSDLYKELVKLGLRISINTNGILLKEEILKTLKAYPPEQINLTIYGAGRNTYQKLCGYGDGYDRFCENLMWLKEAGLPLVLNTTFTRWNLDDMEALVEFARKAELPIRTASYLFPGIEKREGKLDFSECLTPEERGIALASFERLTHTESQIERKRAAIRNMSLEKKPQSLQELPGGSRCMAGCGAFWISFDGQMFPCGMLRKGLDVVQAGFEASWEKLKQEARALPYPSDCLGCEKRRFCPFCQAIYENEGEDMAGVRAHLCAQTDAYLKKIME